MDVGWMWVDVGWMWGGCRVDAGSMWGGCGWMWSFCVKSVEHKGKKRKLLLAEDETVYKVKRSKIENIVEAGKYF